MEEDYRVYMRELEADIRDGMNTQSDVEDADDIFRNLGAYDIPDEQYDRLAVAG